MNVGVVVIGRNEGERLDACFASIKAHIGARTPTVYVDSGSTDDSCPRAAPHAYVHPLDAARPFSAARARNEGVAWLAQHHKKVQFVLCLDGDMEVLPGFIAAALAAFDDDDAAVAAVCGRRLEKHADESIYNAIAQMEWRAGEQSRVVYFGGDVVFRVKPFESVGGYRSDVIAGEEGELADRLRTAGFSIVRLDVAAVTHDTNMHAFHEWWTRAKRCGHAYSQVADVARARGQEKHAEELSRMWKFGAVLPAAAALLAPVTLGMSLGALGFYPLNAARIAAREVRSGTSLRDSVLWGASCVGSVFPQVFGAMKYHMDKRAKRAPHIIERQPK
jgi:GT2 family glycosyltransferase